MIYFQSILYIILCSLFLPVHAANESNKLIADDGASSDWFGWSVSIDNDRAIVGAIRDDDNGGNSGSAYVYERAANGNWIETKLTASDGAANDDFGWSVSIDDDRAIVGATRDDDNGNFTGSAYIYERDANGNWVETKLIASDGNADDYFGISVSINGNRAIVGAYRDDDNVNGGNSGSAYLYERNANGNWIETKLIASDGAPDDNFGWSVSIDGDRAIVGAILDDDNGDRSGAAYVYERNATGNWIETKLTASDGASRDGFGRSVAIAGNLAIIGASLDDDKGINSGSVYVYERDTNGNWAETKLTASDGASEDLLGESVSIDGNRIIVGARQDDDYGSQTGSAYVYQRDSNGNWVETKLNASDSASEDYFGWSVSIDGDRAIVGARLDDDNNFDSGSAYVFELKPQITEPVAGSVLTDPGGTQTFGWKPQLADVSEWWLYVGSTPGGLNYHNSGSLSESTQSATVSGLPDDSSTIHTKLWYRVANNNAWLSIDESYTAQGVNPTITSPAAGSTFNDTIETFNWQNSNASTLQYWLYAGSSPGANNYFDSGSLGNALTINVTGLPIDSTNVWIRLWYRNSGSWSYTDSQYISASGPTITSSSGTGVLTSPNDTFSWTDPYNSVTAWWLYLGSNIGANDYVDSGNLTGVTSYTTGSSNLPAGSTPVHVRLWYQDGSGRPWQSIDSVFTSAP